MERIEQAGCPLFRDAVSSERGWVRSAFLEYSYCINPVQKHITYDAFVKGKKPQCERHGCQSG